MPTLKMISLNFPLQVFHTEISRNIVAESFFFKLKNARIFLCIPESDEFLLMTLKMVVLIFPSRLGDV